MGGPRSCRVADKQTLLFYAEFLPLILLSNNEANCPIATCTLASCVTRFLERSFQRRQIEIFSILRATRRGKAKGGGGRKSTERTKRRKNKRYRWICMCISGRITRDETRLTTRKKPSKTSVSEDWSIPLFVNLLISLHKHAFSIRFSRNERHILASSRFIHRGRMIRARRRFRDKLKKREKNNVRSLFVYILNFPVDRIYTYRGSRF